MATETIKYVGVDDLDLDLFEGQYEIPEGVSYNSYVILDNKIAVMDAVDIRKVDQWLANVAKALNGKQPDYLVVQHLEPDHSGSIMAFHDAYPAAKIIMSARAQQMLPQFFEQLTLDVQPVKEGETLSLGNHELTFLGAPMVHWPEVIVTYDKTDKVLFAADAFGKFGALSTYDGDWACEARRYYFNIVGKYGAQVQALLKKISALDIQIICPLHGPILKDDLAPYIKLYDTWSKYEPEDRGVLVAYASFHGNTAKAALDLADKLKALDAGKIATADLARDDMHEAVEDAFRYDTIVLAAPTYDGGFAPAMVDFIHHLQSKNYQNRRVAFIENGSWAAQSAKQMRAALESLKNITFIDPVVSIKSTLKAADDAKLQELAEAIAKR